MRAVASPAARTGAFVAVSVSSPARAGEASGVLLTFLVTLGAIALAGAAAAISAATPERPAEDVYDAILRLGGAAILACSLAVMAVRHRLVVLGRLPPLSLRTAEGEERLPEHRS
ncbi:hypothetical protein [Streptomyces sp. NPDC047434]|uniref:hypothetical protein n=1 Tax=Streptomyces sp. NPDC047434 TaxID=3155143 RepID=UPI0033C989B3